MGRSPGPISSVSPRLVDYLLRSGPSSFIVGLSGLLLVGEFTRWYCHSVGDNLTMTPLFLLPIIYAAWYLRYRLPIIVLTLLAVALLDGATRDLAESERSRYSTIALQFATYQFVGFLVYHLRRSLQHEQDSSRTDSLTGLINSRGFYEAAELELERMRRSKTAAPLSVLFLDVDNFKVINDSRGHRAGDEALKIVGKAAMECTRRIDLVARIGGDEFVILMPETHSEHAMTVAERLRQKLAATSLGRLTCSFGCHSCTEAPATVDDLLSPADAAMYQAKSAGRDRAICLDGVAV